MVGKFYLVMVGASMKLRFVLALLVTPLFFQSGGPVLGAPGDFGWSLDPAALGDERELLQKTMEILYEECPVLANMDWERMHRQRVDQVDGKHARVFGHLEYLHARDKNSSSGPPPLRVGSIMQQ